MKRLRKSTDVRKTIVDNTPDECKIKNTAWQNPPVMLYCHRWLNVGAIYARISFSENNQTSQNVQRWNSYVLSVWRDNNYWICRYQRIVSFSCNQYLLLQNVQECEEGCPSCDPYPGSDDCCWAQKFPTYRSCCDIRNDMEDCCRFNREVRPSWKTSLQVSFIWEGSETKPSFGSSPGSCLTENHDGSGKSL